MLQAEPKKPATVAATTITAAPTKAAATAKTADIKKTAVVTKTAAPIKKGPAPTPAPVKPAKPITIKEQASIIAKRHGVPPKLFFALIQQESGWDDKAISYVGAVGLTQVMPFNVKAHGYSLSRFKASPVAQLDLGAKMLRAEFDRFGRWDYALAAYNAGPGAVTRYSGIPPYSETISYVRNIMYMANNS